MSEARVRRFRLQKENGQPVPCIEAIPPDLKGVVVAVHGFTSSKESATVQMLLNRLPMAGFGVIGIDLPGHGIEEAVEEELRIKGALDSIEAAEKYAASLYPGHPVFFFGSSFGAYLLALYISLRPHIGERLFFRSAAVNMPKLFIKDNPAGQEKEWMDDLEALGYFDVVMDGGRPVRVTRAFYDDLASNDLFSEFSLTRYGNNHAAMAHGRCDDVIDPSAAKHFAEKFGIPITFFEGEGHSLSNDPATPGKVADLAVRHFLR